MQATVRQGRETRKRRNPARGSEGKVGEVTEAHVGKGSVGIRAFEDLVGGCGTRWEALPPDPVAGKGGGPENDRRTGWERIGPFAGYVSSARARKGSVCMSDRKSLPDVVPSERIQAVRGPEERDRRGRNAMGRNRRWFVAGIGARGGAETVVAPMICGLVVVVVVGWGWNSPAYAQGTRALPSPSSDVPKEWLTKAEETGFVETPRYDETMAYGRKLAKSSPWIRVESFGKSPEGRQLGLVIASKDGAFTPAAAKKGGKLVVLVQNCIHAGECDGKDASLMLLRDMAITKTREALLEHVTLLVIPIFNVDGHERFSAFSRINQNGPREMGWRTTAQNLNLNRDYMKADAPEMRAWLALWNEWQPDFHFDNHVTDGGDWQYDITFDADTHETNSPHLAGWLEETLYPHLFATLEADGHVPAVYFNPTDWRDPRKGIESSGFPPRFSQAYVALRNRPSLLVEMHALKPYRTRVIGNYQVMVRTLELLNREVDSLRAVIRRAENETVAAGGEDGASLVLTVKNSEKSDPLLFKGFAVGHELSELSGAVRTFYDNTKPSNFETTWRRETEPELTVTLPKAYLIPAAWSDLIDRLSMHGLVVERLEKPQTFTIEEYELTDVKFADRPFEGRFAPTFKTSSRTAERTFGPGTALVRLDQPNAKVAVHLLEPQAPDSFVKWGFFNTIFEQKEYSEGYVLEALAREMLDADAALRAEFLEKVQSDRAFAASARERLYFFYRRSPYWDDRLNVYPVARVVGKARDAQDSDVKSSR